MSNKKRLFGMRRLNPFFAAFFVAVSMAGGWLVYRASHAAGYANITFQVIDIRTNQPVPGVDLRIRTTDDRYYCNTPYQVSDGSGYVHFTSCFIGSRFGGSYDHYYFYYVSAPGYTILQPTGYSNYYTLTAGQSYSYTFAVQSSPPPPTPSGCGSGTLNDQCASITNFYADSASLSYNTGTTLHWSTSWASSCSLNGGAVAVNGSAGTGNLTSSKSYTLACSGTNSSPSKSLTVNVAAAPVPTASISATSTSIAYKGTTTIKWSSANASNCTFKAGTSNPGTVGASGSWNTPALTSSTTYAITCSGAGGTSSQVSVGISVAGAPPPPVTGGGGGSSSGGGASTGKGTATSKVAPTAAGDTQPPSAPSNLKATQNDPGSIELEWDASSDNVGVTAYAIERSTDQSTWNKLTDSITDTSYTDNDITFNTHYYYRVYALDAAGNSSNAGLVDITSQAFTANVKADSDATITSDDGVVIVNIPAGSVNQDSYCAIPADDNDKASIPKSLSVIAGTYMLSCKDAKSNDITSFNKQLEFLITVKNQKQQLKLYFADSGKWTDSKVKYSAGAPTFKFNSDNPKPFVVLAAKQSSTLLSLLVGLVLLVLIIVGAIYFIRQRSKRQADYDNYIRQQYIDATTVDKPAADMLPGVPTPDAPAPGQSVGQISQPPRTESGVGVSVGELAQQMAENAQPKLPDPITPSTNPINNNPLATPPAESEQKPPAEG